MRRKVTKETPRAALGDVKAELSAEQLQAIGAVAMIYNEMESWVDGLFLEVTQIPDGLSLEVSTRINGIDGKLEIIKKGAVGLLLAPPALEEVRVALGESGFGLLKKHRDAVIHARIINAPLAIGIRVDRRAALYEVLLTVKALDALYEHIDAMRFELLVAMNLFAVARMANQRADDDPEKGRLEANKTAWTVRFLEHRNHRQSLQPLPEFPSEEEFHAARDVWLQDRAGILRESALKLTNKIDHP